MINESVLHQVPVRLRWGGWQSDTYTLRNKGWQIFAHEQMALDRFETIIRLGVKDPGNKLMIMGQFNIEPRMMFDSPHGLLNFICDVGIDMKEYRATDRIQTCQMSASDWLAMDEMQPTDGFASVPVTNVSYDIRELKLFKFNESPKEIYIPHMSVDECLNRILQLQYPEQRRIKADLKQVEKPIVQAKIYSLAA